MTILFTQVTTETIALIATVACGHGLKKGASPQPPYWKQEYLKQGQRWGGVEERPLPPPTSDSSSPLFGLRLVPLSLPQIPNFLRNFPDFFFRSNFFRFLKFHSSVAIFFWNTRLFTLLRWLVGKIFEFWVIFTLLLLPNSPRLDCRVSGLVD